MPRLEDHVELMRPFRLRQLAPETLAAVERMRAAMAMLRATTADGRALVAASRAQREQMTEARLRLLDAPRPRTSSAS